MITDGLNTIGGVVADGLNSGVTETTSVVPTTASQPAKQAARRGRTRHTKKRRKRIRWDDFVLPEDLAKARKALRQLASELHPDRHQDLDEVARLQLETILRDATVAYHKLEEKLRKQQEAAKGSVTFRTVPPAGSKTTEVFDDLYRAVTALEYARQLLDQERVRLAQLPHHPHWGWPLAVGLLVGVLVTGGVVWYVTSQRRAR